MSVPDIQHALELLRQRDVDAAISSLKKKVEELPAHLTAHVLLARAYEAKRDWDCALRSWENAHFLMPNSPIVIAGKERVLEKINDQEGRDVDATPGGIDPSSAQNAGSDANRVAGHEAPEDRGDASPSPDPPQPPSTAPLAQEAPPEEAPAQEAPADTKAPDTKAPGGGAAEASAAPIAQAQALLSQTPEEPQDADTDAHTDPAATDEPMPEGATTPDTTTTEPPATPMQETPERPEIRTSRSPDTTSYRPDTAIIDAAASLLSREPTPVADTPPAAASSGTKGEQTEAAMTDEATTATTDTAPPHETETTGGDKTGVDDADSGSARPGSSAESFIPDFAAKHSSPATQESSSDDADDDARDSTPETSTESIATTPSQDVDSDSTDAPPASSDPSADAEPSRHGSYDTSELPESRFLDDLGPPETARPLSDDEEDTPASPAATSPESPETANQTDASSDEEKDDAPNRGRAGLDIPSPDDLMPSDTNLDAPPSGRADEDDGGLSELEKLRRSAEAEARRGGARGGMSQPEISGASEETSDEDDGTIGDLDRLIEDLESARIEPRPDLEDLPTPNLESDVEDLVSETLARIYAAQSQYREAARIYVKLASQEPANARDHLENASEMRKKAEAKEAKQRADGNGGNND